MTVVATPPTRDPGCTRSALIFEEFYAAHYSPLVVQLNAYVGNLHEAEEVVQEAFCRAWRRWPRISSYDDPVGWVRRVAWNVATSGWRRARVALSFARRQHLDPVDGPSPDRVALTEALATLPANQRKAVVLHHLVGLPVAEIAAECGVAEGTVKSWLHRGRVALCARLNEEERV